MLYINLTIYLIMINLAIMKGKIHIGKFTKEDSLKSFRKSSREISLENSTGWVSTHKAHRSEKDYRRSPKHKKDYSFE